jgi:dihydrofolate synthase/folylpolyglutamate synthase
LNYSAAIAYLDSLAQFGWKLDLARIERLCVLAGHPERKFRSILVGGSAGKGSTCAILSSILRAIGFKVGTAPKPHLHTHRERAQVNGELISEERFAELMGQIVPLAERVTAEEGPPTVFEVMTLLCFLHFAAEKVDYAVVEVGLGGRFDATNVLPADVSVITMIGLDHTDRLGETVEEIAFEKAGIIKSSLPRIGGGRVVTGATGGALGVIEKAAADRGARIRRLHHEISLENVRLAPGETRFDVATPDEFYPDLVLSLAGEHQARNAALALAAATWLPDRIGRWDPRDIYLGLATAGIPGRMEILQEQPLVIVDAAHSPDRAEALAETVRALYLQAARPVTLILGCSQGHLPETVVAKLAPLADRVIATKSEHPAAIPPAEIAAAARACGASVVELPTVPEALRYGVETTPPEGLVLVTGSLFVAAEAIRASARFGESES